MPRWLRIAFKAILTGSVLVALLFAVELDALVTSLENARWTWVVAALLLLPINLVLDGWVWHQLLRTVTGRVSLRSLVGALLSGLALGFWTPARAGEYAGRALYLPHDDRWAISLTVFAQRMIDMTVGVLAGFLALIWAFWTELLPLSTPWLAAAGIGVGTGLVLTIFVVAPARIHRLTTWLFPNSPSLTQRTILFQRLTRRQGLAVVCGTIARYVVFTGQFALLGFAVAPSATFPLLAGAAGLTFYVKYLIPSLTFLDLGIREGGAAFFFQQLGLGAAAGLNAALLLFTVNVLVPALVGLPFVAHLDLGKNPEGVEAPSAASVAPNSR